MNIPSISDAELEIMKQLWEEHPRTSDAIIDKLSKKMAWSAGTIRTFINRLVKKEAIGYNRKGRTFYYYPIITREDYLRIENISFLSRIYDGAVDKFFYHFLDNEDITEQDIERLEALLLEKKKKSKKK